MQMGKFGVLWVVLGILLVFMGTRPCEAKSLKETLGIASLFDLSLLKANFDKELVSFKTNFKTEIISEIRTEVTAQMKANATVVAGAGNRVSNANLTENIGGNKTTKSSVKNDSDVIKEMIWSYRAVILFLVGQLVIIIKYQASIFERMIKDQVNLLRELMKERDQHIVNLIASKDKKEDKLDEFQEKFILSQTERIKELSNGKTHPIGGN